jgi:serine/threonine protein kinase
MGQVLKAVDTETNKIVAIKKMDNAFLNTTRACATYREVNILRELRGHDGFIEMQEVIVAPSHEQKVCIARKRSIHTSTGYIYCDGVHGYGLEQPYRLWSSDDGVSGTWDHVSDSGLAWVLTLSWSGSPRFEACEHPDVCR